MNFVENSINLMQITSPIPRDPLHLTYNAQNRDVQAVYLGIVKMALRNHVKDINLWTQFKWEKYTNLVNKVNSEAWYISNIYNIKINPLYFEWDKLIPMLERQLPVILNEMLNCDCQWHLLDQNESRSTISRKGEPNYNPRRRINNRSQMLPPPGPRITQPQIRDRFHHGENSSHTTHGNNLPP